MEFHISRAIREKLDLDDLLFSYTGNVVFANVAASRRLAKQLTDLREKEGGVAADASRVVNAGALFAMGLIDELNHALVARYRREIDPSVLSEAVRWFAAQAEPEKLERLLLTFTEQFPNVAVYRGEVTAAQWLKGTTDGLPNREAALEELMLLWIANINPAFSAFGELFEDAALKKQTIYGNVTKALPDYFATRPLFSPEVGSLIDALRAPMLASPDSLTGQLDYIREHWSGYLGEDLKRVLLAIDVLREEDLAIWMRFHPPGPDWHRHGAPGRGGEGFVGDEYIGFDEEYEVGPDGKRKRRYAAGYQAPLNEYEAFSADQAWMPTVVLMAKSTYVWLEQLSKKYGRHIYRLDHIPDEELRLLSERGITGLWLIGLWERSVASRTIKRLRGHHDAVASAYSLKDYQIAEDLGGNSAYEHLRDRAGAFGLRLASDMVPNHMGIDSPWVIEHPDWFIHRWESPFPAYSFNGPDLSTDSRVEIKIDDHYYDQTDAAVAFRLRHYADGSTRYIYHGNDGTTFAWNDTAQLDYSKAYVREHVMQVILHVARLFPIIRFDAAMVLAKRHVQRLWFPLPGAGGSIPSRAENAMSQEEFDALMPHEFWREVVDRVAVEVPGTLLLAEAFWLLEGYFVRTLGMHRVYNSAFMNMLRDEENAKYRSYLKKTIEFDPDILKRYVNFMSNPDERTAIDQFGSEDKYFGVATLLATLPGLPMFGHGQIEGYVERYGMEFKQARMDEWPNEYLVARHQREIAPLLKDRHIFAESTNFVLYDFWTGYGTVNENVFAYSNRHDGQRAIILYNNSYGSTGGTIHMSVGSMDKGSGELRQRSLAEGLGLRWDDEAILAYRDTARGLEYLRRSSDIFRHGMTVSLRGYQYVVLLNWRELHSSAEWPWDRLCDELSGAGVPNLDEALVKLRLRSLHDALREVLSARQIRELAAAAYSVEEAAPAGKASEKQEAAVVDSVLPLDSAKEPASEDWVEGLVKKGALLYERIPADLVRGLLRVGDVGRYKSALGTAALGAGRLGAASQHLATAFPEAARYLPGNDPAGAARDDIWAPILAWMVLHSLPAEHKAELFDKLQLRAALAEIFMTFGLLGEDAWRAAARVRLLLAQEDEPGKMKTGGDSFWADPDVGWLAGVNESEDATYFNKEAFEELVVWLQLPALVRGGPQDDVVEEAFLAAKAAGYNVEKFTSKKKPAPLAEVKDVSI
jgi:glycosidase